MAQRWESGFTRVSTATGDARKVARFTMRTFSAADRVLPTAAPCAPTVLVMGLPYEPS